MRQLQLVMVPVRTSGHTRVTQGTLRHTCVQPYLSLGTMKVCYQIVLSSVPDLCFGLSPWVRPAFYVPAPFIAPVVCSCSWPVSASACSLSCGLRFSNHLNEDASILRIITISILPLWITITQCSPLVDLAYGLFLAWALSCLLTVVCSVSNKINSVLNSVADCCFWVQFPKRVTTSNSEEGKRA